MISKGVLIFFAGIHFVLFLVHLFIFYITRKQNVKDNKLNLLYSVFNFSYVIQILIKKLFFPELTAVTISTTYFLVCTSAYFGYLFFRMFKYKQIITTVWVINTILWPVGIFWNLALKLFYFSAALFALLYIVIIIITVFMNIYKNRYYKIFAIGFITLYTGFIAEGLVQGAGSRLPLLISGTYTAFLVVCFSLYFSYNIYEKNSSLKMSNERLNKINQKLERANKVIEEQKRAMELELVQKVQQIDEMNVDKYRFKIKVKEALLYTLQGFTDEGIAREMDKSESMVKKYLASARETINEKDGYELKSKNDLILHFRKMSG